MPEITEDFSSEQGFTPEINYFCQFANLSMLKDEIERSFCRIQVPARTKIVVPGEICHNSFFIEKGLVRSYTINNGEESTSWLLHEFQCMTSIISFNMQIPSMETVETLEPTTLATISYDDLTRLGMNHAKFSYCLYKIYAMMNVLRESQNQLLKLLDVNSRFRRLLLKDAQMVNRSPLRILASFLNMKPETLSRIIHSEEFEGWNFDDITPEQHAYLMNQQRKYSLEQHA